LFTIDFKSLYTNIPVEDAIKSIKKLCFDFQNVIPNAHFIIDLLDLVLNSSLMVFDGEYFQQIFGLIMGTNVAPILTNIYMAMLENELKMKCKSDPKLIWPVLFKRFIDDGFVLPKEIEKMLFIGLKNSMNYEKLFKSTSLTGETLLITWIYSFTRGILFIRMANFQTPFTKRRLIN